MQARVISADEASEYLTEERCYILELANSSESPDVSIARARVEPGVTTRTHSVAGTAEHYVILAGQGEEYVAGLPDQTVVPRDVVVIPPGIPQSVSNIGADELVFLCVCTPRFDWDNYQSLD